VARHQSLEELERGDLLPSLHRALFQEREPAEAEEVRAAVAEVLLFACLRSNAIKLEVLAAMGQSFLELRTMLETAAPTAVSRLLALVRALAAPEPVDKVIEHLSPDLVDTVVHCLCKQVSHGEVQRWGTAALGALVIADPLFAERAEAGGATCVLWALGADALRRVPMLEQETFFCAHALVKNNRVDLAANGVQLAGLASGAIQRCLRDYGGGAEAITWGLRLLEAMAIYKGGARLIEPYIGTIVDAMLAPGSHFEAATAGSGVVSHLAASSPSAKERLREHKTLLIRCLQDHATVEAAVQTGRARAQEMRDWVQILIDVLGDPRPGIDLDPEEEVKLDAGEEELAELEEPDSDA